MFFFFSPAQRQTFLPRSIIFRSFVSHRTVWYFLARWYSSLSVLPPRLFPVYLLAVRPFYYVLNFMAEGKFLKASLRAHKTPKASFSPSSTIFRSLKLGGPHRRLFLFLPHTSTLTQLFPWNFYRRHFSYVPIFEWVDRWIDGQVSRQIDRWMETQIDRWINRKKYILSSTKYSQRFRPLAHAVPCQHEANTFYSRLSRLPCYHTLYSNSLYIIAVHSCRCCINTTPAYTLYFRLPELLTITQYTLA